MIRLVILILTIIGKNFILSTYNRKIKLFHVIFSLVFLNMLGNNERYTEASLRFHTWQYLNVYYLWSMNFVQDNILTSLYSFMYYLQQPLYWTL